MSELPHLRWPVRALLLAPLLAPLLAVACAAAPTAEPFLVPAPGSPFTVGGSRRTWPWGT